MAVGIGTAIALAVSGIGSAIAAHETAGATTTAATTTSNAADKAAQIQSDAAEKAAELQAQSASEALDFSKQESALSLQQYNAQQQRLQPYRNLGNFAMGLPPDAAPAPLTMPGVPGTTPTTTSPAGSSTMPTTSGAPGATDPVQSYLLSQVQSGISPQQAASTANQKFGLQSGGGAVYYPDTNTIGMPGYYLAGPQGGGSGAWNVVQRQGAGGGGAAGTTNTSNLLPITQQTLAGGQTLINPYSSPTSSGTTMPYNSLATLGGV